MAKYYDEPMNPEDIVIGTGAGAFRKSQTKVGAGISNAQTLGCKADGTTDDSATLTSIAATMGQGIIYLPKGTYRIKNNLTFSDNVIVQFEPGAMLDIDTGITVTFGAGFIAEVQKIFTGSGTVSVNNHFMTTGFPEWWGAVSNDGNVDCLAAIQSCITTFAVTQFQLADYYTSDTIKVSLPHKALEGVSIDFGDNGTGQATRIIVKSATADTLFIGTDANPGSVNNFLKRTRVRFLELTRDRAVTPPPAGQEITGASGIRLQYTLSTFLVHVKFMEHTIGACLNGTVNTHLRECFSFRSQPGNSSTNDLFWGYMQNGNATIGLAGGNGSTYYTDCNASVGGSPALTDSIGFQLAGKPVDTFLLRPETSSLNQGISVGGDTSQNGNCDVHIIGAVIDQFGLHGIYLDSIGDYGAVSLVDCYVAPVSASQTTFGFRVNGCTGMTSITNCQCIAYGNNLCIGEYFQNSKGIQCKNNMILGALRPISLDTCDSCVIEDNIHNPGQIASQGAVWVNASTRCRIAPVIRGEANAFPQGVYMNGAGNDYNEINCTGIDPASISGGATNKLQINGAAVTTTGLSGTNLVSGVMN